MVRAPAHAVTRCAASAGRGSAGPSASQAWCVTWPSASSDVAAELDGDLIVRMAAVPDRDREAHGLEVQERHGRCDAGQGIGQARVDDHPPGLNGSALPVRGGAE